MWCQIRHKSRSHTKMARNISIWGYANMGTPKSNGLSNFIEAVDNAATLFAHGVAWLASQMGTPKSNGLSWFIVICPMKNGISGPARLLPLPLCTSLCLGQRFLHIGTNASMDEIVTSWISWIIGFHKLWKLSLFFRSIACLRHFWFYPVDG